MPASVLPLPPGLEPSRAVRDLSLTHPLIQQRWPMLCVLLESRGLKMFVVETYRYHERQRWLFGAGRTAEQLKRYGVPTKYARPAERIVTNSWSALNSAHGWTRHDDTGKLVPAAAALDVVPVGADNKPFTTDDEWQRFLHLVEVDGASLGLVHFHKPGKPPWDKPHLQLTEWSDREKLVKLALPS